MLDSANQIAVSLELSQRGLVLIPESMKQSDNILKFKVQDNAKDCIVCKTYHVQKSNRKSNLYARITGSTGVI